MLVFVQCEQRKREADSHCYFGLKPSGWAWGGAGTVVDLEQKDPGWPPQPCKSTDRVGKLQIKIYLYVNRIKIKIKQTRPFKVEV